VDNYNITRYCVRQMNVKAIITTWLTTSRRNQFEVAVVEVEIISV